MKFNTEGKVLEHWTLPKGGDGQEKPGDVNWLHVIALDGNRLVVHYQGQNYFPVFKDYSEKTFGGDFPTPADYLDPFIRKRLSVDGNWAVFAPNPYGAHTINYFAAEPNPSGPSRANASDSARSRRAIPSAVRRSASVCPLRNCRRA